MQFDISDLLRHVGCGSLDEHGQCETCESIRNVLRSWLAIMNGFSTPEEESKCAN